MHVRLDGPERLVLRPSAPQRVKLIASGIAMIVMAGWALSQSVPRGAAVLLVAGVVGAATLTAMHVLDLVLDRPSVTLDESGVHRHHAMVGRRRRHVPWSEIERIDPIDPSSDQHRATIRYTTTSGHRDHIPAILFAGSASDIRSAMAEWWEQGRTSAPSEAGDANA